MTLGKKIKNLREQSGYLQRELATELGIGEGYLSKVENDIKPLKKEHLLTISQIFKVPLADLETLWLASKIYYLIKDEEYAEGALKVAEEQIKYRTRK